MHKLKYKTKSKLLLLLLIIALFYPLVASTFISFRKSKDALNLQEINVNEFQLDQHKNNEWERLSAKVDTNSNGINDNFEPRLKQLSEFGFIEENLDNYKSIPPDKNIIDFPIKKEKTNINKITSEAIPVIISFLDGDYKYASLLFEDLGGRIKHKYTVAINGFAGSIEYTALNKFCDTLRENNIAFLIEEDRTYHAHLYYTSRNMNLRPYVWDTLSYRGDGYSSIAIIDTGIDDSHNFFTPGYSDGDSSYKIVGWRDEVNLLASPYDDNGHGSHCGGIAAGTGSPAYDGSSRSVATAAYYFDYTGYDISEGEYVWNWTRFRVDTPGVIEMVCEFEDFTPGPDDCDFWAYIYHENTLVESYIDNSDSWMHNLTYTVTSGSLGDYSFRFITNLVDNTGDGYCTSFNIRFRNEIHWPSDPPLYGSGDQWQGVANEARLVGIKVLDQYGSGWSSDIINGINWAITNRIAYNITTISMSLGGSPGATSMINAVNNAVENGIVTVVAAGNSGPGGNFIGSPGDADNVITVAAMNIDDEITDYSSQGGLSYSMATTKPDITAPGGSFNNIQMFSTDTNDNDGEGTYPSDGYLNDLFGAQGTSMSAPAVAGASNLVIDAMGGYNSWGFTAEEAKSVKSLLLMSATETYPLTREVVGAFYSPLLNRGEKDVHEGYGRLNVDAAIEAYTQQLTLGSDTTAYLTASSIDSFDKHALGCYVNLIEGETYIFTLDVPVGADFDFHLYNSTPSSIGEPIMMASSISPNLGEDEVIAFTATETGKYYLIAKAISGEGDAVISYPIVDHDLHVSLEVPDNPDVYGTYVVNATVLNNGLSAETNVNLFLYIDEILVDSDMISTLNVDQELTINYLWNPTRYEAYNITAYAPLLPGEPIEKNNYVEKIVRISPNMNYTMTVGAPYSWVDASGGTELLLGDDGFSEISLPFSFDFYNETFSTVYLGANGYLSFTDPSPSDYSNDPIPSADIDNHYLIALFWDDLYLPSGGHIYVQSFGSYWVAEWLDIYHISGPLVGSFEVILYQSGEIVFNYDYLDYTTGGYTCGLNLGVDIRYYNTYQNLNSLTDDFALLFSPWWGALEHDLAVSLDLPSYAQPNNAYLINASITNKGIYDESNVDLYLYLDNTLIAEIHQGLLLVDQTITTNYLWTPTTYGDYTFMASAPYLSIEPYIDNNIVEKTVHIKKINIFDGLFLNYSFSIFGETYSMDYLYSNLSDGMFHVDYSMYNDSVLMQIGFWDVFSQTRIMSSSAGGFSFGSGTHTPLWIFTDISLGDETPIAIDAAGDYTFKVSSELVYNLSGYGDLEVWVLEDISNPACIAWYEKSTGILIKGTFIFLTTEYTLELIDTNAPFQYYAPSPGEGNLLLIIAITGAIAIGVVVAVIIIVRKRRK